MSHKATHACENCGEAIKAKSKTVRLCIQCSTRPESSKGSKRALHEKPQRPAKLKRSEDKDAHVDYKGYRPAKGDAVERISCDSISPEEFYRKYVAQRRPVVIEGLLQQAGNRFSQWSNSYLIKQAGAAVVQIEEKGEQGAFGTGKEKHRMAFGDFVKKLESGVDNLYLTTQYDADSDDTPKLSDLLPPPVSHFQGDFPLRPSLLSTLVPQQLNMWMGHSKEGASSGLHCDFHDNLYLLLRGRKRFHLYAPSDVNNLYLHGKVQRVHSNGLLAFEKGIRADGAPLELVTHWRAQLAARRIKKDKEGVADEGDDEEAEKALMAALDNIDDDIPDDFAALEGTASAGESEGDPVTGKRKRRAVRDSKKAERREKDSSKVPAAAAGTGTAKSEPPSFSRIDTATLRSAFRSPLFPKLHNACSISVELREGDALYLPASWFHEVTSFSAGTSGHLAFNYWFHPPTTGSFNAPYEDDFWAARFAKLLAQIKS